MVLKEKELLPLKIGGGGKHLNGTPIKKGLFLWLHLQDFLCEIFCFFIFLVLGLLLHSSIIRGYMAFGAHFFLNCFMTHGFGPAEMVQVVQRIKHCVNHKDAGSNPALDKKADICFDVFHMRVSSLLPTDYKAMLYNYEILLLF